MSLRIRTNTPALNAQRNLYNNNLAVDKSLEKLSSGYRINVAGDDPAGLAVSEGLRAKVRGLKQAWRNAQDGISMIQIAEGGLHEIANILSRLRELGVQASSDTTDSVGRQLIDVERKQMLEELDRIANSTEFNGTSLISGVGELLEFQIGTGNNPQIDRLEFDASKADANSDALGVDEVNFSEKVLAQNSLSDIDKAIVSVSSMRADFGSLQNRLLSTLNNLAISVENTSAAQSRIRDVDIAEETTNLTKNNILVQAGTSVLAQANQNASSALQLLNKTFS